MARLDLLVVVVRQRRQTQNRRRTINLESRANVLWLLVIYWYNSRN